MIGPQALLTSNAGIFERAIAQAMDDGGLPVPIQEIMDPATCPEPFLPFLAAHRSVDLWYPDWTDDRKRTVITNAVTDAWLKGTRAGVVQFLSYVDGTLLDTKAYPRRFVFGHSFIGSDSIGLGPYRARYLVRVNTQIAPKSLVFGGPISGRFLLGSKTQDAYDRVLAALRVAKAPETQVLVDFQHQRMINIADNVAIDGTYRLGQYIERNHF